MGGVSRLPDRSSGVLNSLRAVRAGEMTADREIHSAPLPPPHPHTPTLPKAATYHLADWILDKEAH